MTPRRGMAPTSASPVPSKGQTRSRFLTAQQAVLARQQIEAGHEFRSKLEAYWEGCEDWADRQLEGSGTASAEEAEKGSPKRTSTTRSSKKSRRP